MIQNDMYTLIPVCFSIGLEERHCSPRLSNRNITLFLSLDIAPLNIALIFIIPTTKNNIAIINNELSKTRLLTPFTPTLRKSKELGKLR